MTSADGLFDPPLGYIAPDPSMVVHEGQITGSTASFVLGNRQALELFGDSDESREWIRPYVTSRALKYSPRSTEVVIDVPAADVERLRKKSETLYAYLQEHVLERRQAMLNQARAALVLAGDTEKKKRVLRNAQQEFSKGLELHNRRSELICVLDRMPRYLVALRNAPIQTSLIVDFVSSRARPSEDLAVIPLCDTYSFGILSSSIHQRWMWERGPTGRSGSAYDFKRARRFPWPASPTPKDVQNISNIGSELLELRVELRNNGVHLDSQYRHNIPAVTEIHSKLNRAVVEAYVSGQEDAPTFVAELNRHKVPPLYPCTWKDLYDWRRRLIPKSERDLLMYN